MTRALLLALLAAGCGHYRKHVTETTATKETTSSTEQAAAETVQSNDVAQKQTVRRTARRILTRPDGWTVTEEQVDEMLTVRDWRQVVSASSSASATAEASKEVKKDKAADYERKPASPWRWLGLVPFAAVAVVLFLLVRHFRRLTGRWVP